MILNFITNRAGYECELSAINAAEPRKAGRSGMKFRLSFLASLIIASLCIPIQTNAAEPEISCENGIDESVEAILGSENNFLGPIPPVSSHFTGRILGRTENGIRNAMSNDQTFDDASFESWVETSFEAVSKIIDTKIHLIQQERSLMQDTTCLHIDLFLIETMMEKVRCKIQYAFEQKKFVAIIELKDIILYLDKSYNDLVNGARHNSYTADWTEVYSFDERPHYCHLFSDYCELYPDGLFCGPYFFETMDECVSATEYPAKSHICPFHSDYLPPTTIIPKDPEPDPDSEFDPENPYPSSDCPAVENTIEAVCMPPNAPWEYDYCSGTYGVGSYTGISTCGLDGECLYCLQPKGICHDTIPNSVCLAGYQPVEDQEANCRNWCENANRRYEGVYVGHAVIDCNDKMPKGNQACCSCSYDFGVENDPEPEPENSATGYGCDLDVLNRYNDLNIPDSKIGDAIQVEIDAMQELINERDKFILSGSYLKDNAVKLDTWMGRTPAPELAYFGRTASVKRVHKTLFGCSEAPEEWRLPLTEEEKEEGTGRDPNSLWPPVWPNNLIRWQTHGSFSLDRNDLQLMQEYEKLRVEWGKRRPLAYELPEEFGFNYFLQLYFRNQLKDWGIYQERLTSTSVTHATDVPQRIITELTPLRESVGEFSRYASSLNSKGIRSFARGLAYYLRRSCLTRPCNERLERILKVVLQSACFPYTDGNYSGNVWEECKRAAKLDEFAD
ncbi:MAG: hypothetical protein K9M03_02660 [Kiritimatiellales bacterium]|nr:hypothetical protein [Kiritimatiellales bacterium]